MTISRWDRLEALLERAGEVPAALRAEFVERETSDDPALRAELSALLEASDGASEYFSRLRHELLGTAVQGIVRDDPTAKDSPDPWIGRTVSHYRIFARIGGGGMGVIYRASDVRLGRTVALKFIAPEIRSDSLAQERFLQEARAASALDHPNICTIHEIAETDDGRQFIVMAAYDGETLRARIERPPIPEAEALDIAGQIAQALAAAHERGIVHRDVKPDNVFVTREGVVKLLDFGLARVADHRMSGPSGVVGTVSYMSPEQASGQRTDERSDVWALGVTLFEMLAGVRPFAAPGPAAVVDLILTQEPNLAAMGPHLSAGIFDFVGRALAKDPARRFGNGGEAFSALKRCHPSTTATKAPGRTAVPRALRIGAGSLGLLTLALVALRLRTNLRPGPAGGDTAARGTVSHVLWVDDNPENNAAVLEQLEQRGVQVTRALSTAEAIQRYDPAVYQLVISDMGRYEGVNNAYVERAGFDLLERLRARRPDVRLVFCTSERAAITHRAEALSAGALTIVADCTEVLRVVGF